MQVGMRNEMRVSEVLALRWEQEANSKVVQMVMAQEPHQAVRQSMAV
jgi:hypothetical protein